MSIIKIFKKGTTPLTTGLDTYMVQWECCKRYRYTDGATLSNMYQAFASEHEANDFADSLRRAIKLLGNKGFNVSVRKMERNGLDD